MSLLYLSIFIFFCKKKKRGFGITYRSVIFLLWSKGQKQKVICTVRLSALLMPLWGLVLIVKELEIFV
jgi:hypothetical protein